jgi:glycosyltransferase involved in cell wall biosynthesis
MNSKLSISVAIGTYNRAAMVKQAVEAALEQTRKPDEVIVSDDASPDCTVETLEALLPRHPELKVINQPVNQGVNNWNQAVNATSGDLIAWCSDDDRFLPQHLEASERYLREHPEIGMVHSSFIDAIEVSDGQVLTSPRQLRSLKPIDLDRRNLLSYMIRFYDWPFHPSTIVMRRAVWERVGGFDLSYALSDTDWFVRVAEQFRIALLPRHGVTNRRHPGNWSNKVGSAKMQGEIFEIVDRSIERMMPQSSMTKTLFRWIWRTNVRLRLLLTVRARVRSGHQQAASSAWQAITRYTGNKFPLWFEELGLRTIRHLTARRQAIFKDARQSVSPL